MASLTLSNIGHSFGALRILEDISLSIPSGERHAIIGPNGAGKSTLMNIISGKLRPTRGELRFDGKRISGRSPHQIARQGIGRAFQIINTFASLTVFENIRSAVAVRLGQNWNCWTPLAAIDKITTETMAIVRRLGLEDRKDVVANALAYGEQRALEIALCLALSPRLMLLDEPCAGLNAEDTAQAIKLIRSVSDGLTLLMIEHDMEVVFGVADRITVLHQGNILAIGAPAEIRADPRVREAYLGGA